MKIGLSFSRCILDIIEERVDVNDVLVIISRTDFDPFNDDQWKEIWDGYANGGHWTDMTWSGSDKTEKDFRQLTQQMYKDGQIHQPRKFGAHPPRIRYHWLDAMLPETELQNNVAAKEAWDHFNTIAGLVR